MNNIAIIPARGGSKRIPGKNIRPFFGLPIIAYSIRAAIESNLFAEVMVSTDDEAIAEIATQHGAVVPFMRSKKNADDYATTSDVINEVLDYYARENRYFETACCIYATAPFVTGKKLQEAFDLLKEEKFDSVFPVMKYSFPIQRSFKMDANGRVTMFYPEYIHTRSQDLLPAYHDAGQFYFFDVAKFLSSGKIYSDNSGSILLTEMEGHDIDNHEDWILAELKWQAHFRK